MSMIKSWMSSHPFMVVFFTFWFTAIPIIMAFRDDMFKPGLILFTLVLIVWILELWGYIQKMVPLLIISALLSSQVQANDEQPKPQAAAIGVAVVVICVGGYCVYKIVKICEKKFPPKDTNAPPEQFMAASGEYGGACEYSSIGSCYVPPSINSFPYEDLNHNPTTFTLNVMVEPGGVTTTMSADNREGTTQTWDQFQSEIASHGLFLTGHPSQPQYEMDGVPCDRSMVPLEFDPLTGRVVQGLGVDLRQVVVERSPNLVDWFPLLRTSVGVGIGFKCIDCTRENSMFYRVNVQ